MKWHCGGRFFFVSRRKRKNGVRENKGVQGAKCWAVGKCAGKGTKGDDVG
ncbi:hypothetical protein HMPREF3034_00841 [Prevotella sp. DNF00663]|nr:hypothetical protein HMPREF3034_00841 [Prevotella sp. DNF00663]